MDCGLPGSSVHGIFQARILEWVAISFLSQTPEKIQKYFLGKNNSTLWHPSSPLPNRSWMILCQDQSMSQVLNFPMIMPGLLPACHTYKAYGCHFNWQCRLSTLWHSWEDPAKNLQQPRICKEHMWHINAGESGDASWIPGSGRSPGGGNVNPLYYCCQKNPMDRGDWWATVHGLLKSQAWLNNWAQTQKDIIATHSCRFFMSYSYVKLAPEIVTFVAFIILSLYPQSILKGFELKSTKFIRFTCLVFTEDS